MNIVQHFCASEEFWGISGISSSTIWLGDGSITLYLTVLGFLTTNHLALLIILLQTYLTHPPIYWSLASNFKGLAFSRIHSNSYPMVWGCILLWWRVWVRDYPRLTSIHSSWYWPSLVPMFAVWIIIISYCKWQTHEGLGTRLVLTSIQYWLASFLGLPRLQLLQAIKTGGGEGLGTRLVLTSIQYWLTSSLGLPRLQLLQAIKTGGGEGLGMRLVFGRSNSLRICNWFCNQSR